MVGCVCSVLQRLRALVAMNESLKKQEQQFKAHCKAWLLCALFIHTHTQILRNHPHYHTHTHTHTHTHSPSPSPPHPPHPLTHSQEEKGRLEEAIARLEAGGSEGDSEEMERVSAIKQHFEGDKAKLQKIRALLVRTVGPL